MKKLDSLLWSFSLVMFIGFIFALSLGIALNITNRKLNTKDIPQSYSIEVEQRSRIK